MIHFILTLVFVLAALPDRNDAESDDSVKFQNLLVRASPNDAGARLELGAWCEERGHFAWAAQCYNQILKLGSSIAYPEALFRLAKIDLDNKQYEAGYAKLREVVDRYQHPEASGRLERAENSETRKQQAILSKAFSHASKRCRARRGAGPRGVEKDRGG